MKNIVLSASLLALVVGAPTLSIAANHDAKKSITSNSKNPELKGDGIVLAQADSKKDPKADMTASPDTAPVGPGLEISGGTSFNAFAFKQLVRGAKGRGSHFGVDDSRINFEVSGKAGPRLGCLEYSFLIGMTGNTEENTTTVEENRIKLKHRFGTLLAGVHRGVTDFMSVGAFTFHNGTGNVLGNYTNIANLSAGAVVKDDPAGHGKDRTKITYVTPRFLMGDFGGVQFGYSYTPDGEQRGAAKLNTLTSASGKITPAGQNLHELGVNFKGEFANGFGTQLSFTGLMGSAKSLDSNAAPTPAAGSTVYGARQYNDVRSYAIGLVLSYAGFSLGGEYLANGKSLALTGFQQSVNNAAPVTYNVTDVNAGRVYNFGIGYSQDRHGVSLGYLKSDRKLGTAVDAAGVQPNIELGKVESKVYSASYDYKIAKGLKAYVEATHFDTKHSNDAGARIWNQASTNSSSFVGSNNGNAFIAGIALSF